MSEAEKSRKLGFLRPEKYGHYERERRWLCERLPDLEPTRVFDITDKYLSNSRMRLRRMSGRDVPDELKLTKKGELSADTRIITTIYLDEAEFDLLNGLNGQIIRKTRHYFDGNPEVAVDIFRGPLAGLIMAEVEFLTAKDLKNYEPPEWMGRDVTSDEAYAGGSLISTSNSFL